MNPSKDFLIRAHRNRSLQNQEFDIFRNFPDDEWLKELKRCGQDVY